MMDVTMKNYEMLERFSSKTPEALSGIEHLANVIESPITRAQAKALMTVDSTRHQLVSADVLNYAVELREPMFIETALNISAYIAIKNPARRRYAEHMLMFKNAISFLTDVSRREVLKSIDNAKGLYAAILKACDERKQVYAYALYDPAYVEAMHVDNVYRAAWVIVNGSKGDEVVTGWEYFTLKALKTALKNVERIDRYAQIEHIEYNYSSGIAKEVKDILDTCNIPEFKPIYFETSKDIAAEGEIMNNCIAGSWNAHTFDSFYCACIYKGVRMDIEISKDFVSHGYAVFQLFEKNNKESDLTDELRELLEACFEEYWWNISLSSTADAVILEFHSTVGLPCAIDTSTGEVLIDQYEEVKLDSCKYYVGMDVNDNTVVYVHIHTRYDKRKTIARNITGTEQAGEVLDELERVHATIERRAKLEREYDTLFDDEDNDSDDLEFQDFFDDDLEDLEDFD